MNNLLDCKHLLQKRFPLIFHGVKGEDEREGSSPSWFNSDEVLVVVSYVAKLLQGNNINVSGEEIGIITPYLKQAQKIRETLAVAAKESGVEGFEQVQVGTCEQFQGKTMSSLILSTIEVEVEMISIEYTHTGKESRVVIISTVRSSASQLRTDGTFNLGFVKNPKRFNVAVTRAQALLIIVGNPYLLQRDPCWGSMIRYCHDNKAYTGEHSLSSLSNNCSVLSFCSISGCVWPLPGQAVDYDEEVDSNSSSGVNTTIKKEGGGDDDDEISSYYDSSDNEEYVPAPPKKRSLGRSVFLTPPPKKSRIVKIEK